MILNPISISTPVGNSVVAKKIYRSCVTSVGGKETLKDLIELDMQDFDSPWGWIGYIVLCLFRQSYP